MVDRYSLGSRSGATVASWTQWISDTSLMCNNKAGRDTTLSFALTIGQMISSLSESESYDSGMLSNLKAENIARTSGGSLSISGAGFNDGRL